MVDELYPYYIVFKETDEEYDPNARWESTPLEVEDELMERYNKVYTEFFKLREELRQLAEQQNSKSKKEASKNAVLSNCFWVDL